MELSTKICPFCNKIVPDFLKHLRFTHKINSADRYNSELAILEKRKNRQHAFAKYVEELQLKKKNGEITAEIYRELITEWINQNERGCDK